MPGWLRLTVAVSMGLMIACASYAADQEVAFSVFYLAPVILTGWTGGIKRGIVVAACCASFQVLSKLLWTGKLEKPVIDLGNAISQVVIFSAVIVLVVRLKQALDTQAVLARTDSLTGLLNRRAFFECAEKEMERTRRYGGPITIVFIDCDDFKLINDQHGHAAGDQLIAQIGASLTNVVRSNDYAARIGGDEFACLLVETSVSDAQPVLEKIRFALSNCCALLKGVQMTFSIGAVSYYKPPSSVTGLIAKADHAMYLAKQRGKDQVVHVSGHPEEDEQLHMSPLHFEGE